MISPIDPWPRQLFSDLRADDKRTNIFVQAEQKLKTKQHMSLYTELKEEYEDILEKITTVEREAAEERDNENESQADALDKHVERLEGLANIVKQKLFATNASGSAPVSQVELDHLHLVSKISREIRDCKIELTCSKLSITTTTGKVDEARQNHINTLEGLLQKLTR